ANVLLDAAARPKLSDFGLAKSVAAQSLTASGDLMGSPGFIAPELIAGKKADVASDLYALGCTLFQVFTGQLPFQGDAIGLLKTHASAPPPRLRSLVPDAAPELEALVARLLAKAPAERPASAAEVAAALDAIALAPEARRQSFAAYLPWTIAIGA